VDKITEDLFDGISSATNALGTGGILTKLQAAQIAVSSGVMLYIANGNTENIILRIINGDEIGTKFIPEQMRKLSSRDRWIAWGSGVSSNRIVIDEGAKKALLEKGKSLLPSGIVKVEGNFKPGDVVQIVDMTNEEIARGLVNYDSGELDRIKGLKTSQIESALGHKGYDEAIHRNNLVLMVSAG
jgi:glutamate 5-kinase